MDFGHPMRVVTPTLDGEVLTVLTRADASMTGRQIHRLAARGSEVGIKRAADRLVEEGVLLREAVGQAHHYRLNREHLAAPALELLAALREEFLSRLRGAVAQWEEPPLAAVLFGSVARGEGTPASDVDLLVIRRAGEDPESAAWHAQLASLQRQATRWTGNDLRILEFTEDEIRDGPLEPAVAEALEEGLGIYGSRRELRRLARGERR